MSRSVEFLPDAEMEVSEAFRWYERHRTGLGLEFLRALEAAVERVRRAPDAYELVALRTRKVLLRRFPYLLLYAVEGDRIVVTAVFHGRRNPIRWSDRVREELLLEADLGLTAVDQEVPEGCVGFIEELPGANPQGATLEEARASLHEAARIVLDANRSL